MRAIVVGDDIWDHYIEAVPVGISNKTAAPVIRHLRPLAMHHGGTHMVALHMRQFCKSAECVTPEVSVTKIRYVTPRGPDHKTLVEVLVQPKHTPPLRSGVDALGRLLVCMDYGHGALSGDPCRPLTADTLVVNVQSNSWSSGYQDVSRWVDQNPALLMLDEREFKQAKHDRSATPAPDSFRCPFIVTRGNDGLYHSQFGHVPALAVRPLDRTGAGDAALAMAALMTAAKADPEVVAWSAAIMGSLKAGLIWGNERPVLHEEFVGYVKGEN